MVLGSRLQAPGSRLRRGCSIRTLLRGWWPRCCGGSGWHGHGHGGRRGGRRRAGGRRWHGALSACGIDRCGAHRQCLQRGSQLWLWQRERGGDRKRSQRRRPLPLLLLPQGIVTGSRQAWAHKEQEVACRHRLAHTAILARISSGKLRPVCAPLRTRGHKGST